MRVKFETFYNFHQILFLLFFFNFFIIFWYIKCYFYWILNIEMHSCLGEKNCVFLISFAYCTDIGQQEYHLGKNYFPEI